MAKTVTQIAMEGSIFKRTEAYKRQIIPTESQVKTLDYISHLKQLKALRMLRTR